MFEVIHNKEKSRFKIEDWLHNYRLSQEHRGSWESQARQCLRVRENDIPEGQGLPNFKNYRGRYYKDNMIFKHIKWLEAKHACSMIGYDVDSMTTYRDENTELLEMELNMLSSQLEIAKYTSSAVSDMLYTGMGYVRLWWDKKRVSVANKTGSPVIEHVSCMKMYLDANTHHPDKSDMDHIFHVEKYHWQNLSIEYPEMKGEFKKRADRNGLVEVVLVQYKTEHDIECVLMTDRGQHPEKEWIVPIEEMENGKSVIENDSVTVSFPFEVRKTFWYEAKFFPDLKRLIQLPTFVGEFCSYHVIHYQHQLNSAYSLGLCYYMYNLLEINIALMTSLMVQAFQYQKADRLIVSGALLNEEQYIVEGRKYDIPALISPEYNETHPGEDPVRYLKMPDFPQAFILLNSMLKESMMDISGVTKALQGESEFANESGVQLSLKQNAGQTYHKFEQLRYQHLLLDIGKSLLWMISQFRMHPHPVSFLNEENQEEMVMVNDPEVNPFTFEPDRVTISCIMEEDVAMMKQLQYEKHLGLFDRGVMSGRKLLDSADVPHAQMVYDEAMHEKGIFEIMEFIKENPDAMDQVKQLMGQG